MPVDFFARRTHYIDHMLPVWAALNESERGTFYAPVPLLIAGQGSKVGDPIGNNPLLVAGVGDLQYAVQKNSKRKFIFMEHGVGITYGAHQAYAGGGGLRRKVSLFLAPNEIVRAKTEKTIPGANQVVIGTPKLDRWTPPPAPPHRSTDGEGRKTVCISFHWNGSRVQPEAGNAFEHFKKYLPALTQQGYQLLGHGHPREFETFERVYKQCGIEPVRSFDEVMQRADVYVCDNSSTIYEFLVTGKPVVIMNSPQYRKNVHWGIRFWEYTDVGPMVDGPVELMAAIQHELHVPAFYRYERDNAVRDLYPYLGCSAQRAADAIREFVIGK